MARRIIQLTVGLVFYGFGIALMVRGAIGVSPWDVLSQGISRQSGIPFGLVINIVGVLVLTLWIPLRQRPGIGTVLNVLLIGPASQLGLILLPAQTELWAQILLFVAGLLLVAIATGLYIGARFGPGPRDGLMTGAHRRLGWPIWLVRTIIELVVLTTGWLLGGNVGIGTAVFAVLIGPLVHLTLPLFAVEPVPTKQNSAEHRPREQTELELPVGIDR